MLEILYKDSNIAVVLKKPGMLSEEQGNKSSVPLALKTEQGLKNVYSVHRLDKNVGGVMVYALDSKTAGKLSEQISSRDIEKNYIAILSGIPEKDEDTLKDLLFRDSKINKTYVVTRDRKGVRDASLEYKVIAKSDGSGAALVAVKLHTGRTHQIRVQFASRGLPLIGDGRYGSRDGKDIPALFSARLSFKHPRTGKVMEFIKIPEREGTPFGIFQDGELHAASTAYSNKDN